TDDVEFAEKLLSDAGVALVPGSAFGTPGYMRLSFATSMNTLRDAVARLSKALS
ncbi:MAG: aminotransferase class I/II-fold pyridoxal phosphate-dependent enzyme, partial [Pseudomonadota bacterium]|nr:aminotransferase class I/II-fold pyridoxal phosphate-dependent enzyme [Pseudomonadota bacterium]